MENATKALEMVAGVFLGLIILGALTLGFNRIKNLRNTQYLVEEETQAAEFNKNFEEYNSKGIYGSQIFSLANKVEDYNNKYEVEGYETLTITVKIKNDHGDGTYFRRGTYQIKDLSEKYKTLSNKIIELGNEKVRVDGKEKTVLEASKLAKVDLDRNAEVKSKVEKYLDLIDLQYEVVRTTFDCISCEYDLNGRITKMIFEEK